MNILKALVHFIMSAVWYIAIMVGWGIVLLVIMIVSFAVFDILLGADALSTMK
jgi:uncharacterized membrane protein